MIPEIPRLAHDALARQARPIPDLATQALLRQMAIEQRRLRRRMTVLSLVAVALLGLQAWHWLNG
jgi:hypothetical protein